MESYIASGLLGEVQGLSQIECSNECVSASSAKKQESCSEGALNDGVESAEASECSERSARLGCGLLDSEETAESPTFTDRHNRVGENTCEIKVENPHSALSYKEYYASSCARGMQYSTRMVEELSAEDILPDPCITGYEPDQSGSQDLSRMSTRQEAEVSPRVSRTLKLYALQFGEAREYSNTVSFLDSVLDTSICLEKDSDICDKQDQLTSEVDCQNKNLVEASSHLASSMGAYYSGSNNICLNCPAGSRNCQFNGQSGGTYDGLCNLVSSLDMLSIPCSQSILSEVPIPIVRPINGREASAKDLEDDGRSPEAGGVVNSASGFSHTRRTAIPCGFTQKYSSGENCEDEVDSTVNTMKVISVSSQDINGLRSSSGEKQSTPREDQHLGTSFDEQPGFPKQEVPFVSCDLMSSRHEQQSYSPLGVRQLMIPSTSCLTPYKLWDSPSSDDSPDAVIKSAAKSFLYTPSIMKKRQRELLSPLHKQRNNKKSGKESRHELGTSSVKENGCFQMDVMSDENGSCVASFSSTSRTIFSSSCYQKNNPVDFPDKKKNLVDGVGKDGSQVLGTIEMISNNNQRKREPVGHDLDGRKGINVDKGSDTVSSIYFPFVAVT